MNLKFACVASLLALTSSSAVGQQQGRIPYGGSEVFRFGLYENKIKELTDPRDALNFPRESIIIVLGDSSQLSSFIDPVDLRDFVDNGGAVLIASDSSNQQNVRPGVQTWGQQFGISINGMHVTADQDKCYRQLRGRPFVRPRQPVWNAPSPFDLFAGIEANGSAALATDHPSEMSFRPPFGFRASNLAAYPENSRLVAGPRSVEANRNHFAVALEQLEPGGVGPGRLLVLADHSVFVNGMLGFQEDPNVEQGFKFDNANWQFSNRTIDWLKAGPQKPRSKCLFIEDGRIVEKFAIEVPPIPRPPMPDIPPDVLANLILNQANHFIRQAEEQNFFNRVLEGWLGLPRLLRMFLIVTTIIFVLVCLTWLSRSNRKPESSSTLTPAAQARFLPRGGMMRQRTAAQLEVANLFEGASRRVRVRFDVLGGQPSPSGKMPSVLLADDLRDAPILHESVCWLWQIGYGENSLSVPPEEWDRFNGTLERVTRRAARGDWSFGQDAA
ncbi:MAG: hypothetical protein EXS09_16135 [Gemmataceae bacterium]|nr:hypothetical protein [Gemmataceae bacterium]